MTGTEVVETDVLIVGGGPSGLSAAVHLADLIRVHNESAGGGELPLNILLLEKGSAIASHILSGAVVNPSSLRMLLPEVPESEMPFDSPVTSDSITFLTRQAAFRMPFHPPYMGNRGNYICSLGQLTQWLAGIAEKKGVQVYPGFAACDVIYEDGEVAGVRTGESGVDRHGNRQPNYQPPTEVRAKLVIFAEGSRGHLAKKLIQRYRLDEGKNPQVYSIGVKELWSVPPGTLVPGTVIHTMGYPLGLNQFGGSFIYGFSGDRIAVGLVAGLDYEDPTFDPHRAFQIYKAHPFVRRYLEQGKVLCYGAKTIPEGGFYSMPRPYHDRFLLVGDSAGYLAMPSLKGIHLGVESGMMAAKVAFEGLKANDFSRLRLSRYEQFFRQSHAWKALYPVRNFRQGFQKNLLIGAFHFGSQLALRGRGFSVSGRLKIEDDFKRLRPAKKIRGQTFMRKFSTGPAFDKKLTFDKVTDVFYSGAQHDEHQPCHCKVTDPEALERSTEKFGAPSQYFCPAEVYELVLDPKTGKKEIRFHPTNCVHCKTCDIKSPYQELEWMPPYGGDGPEYENM